MFYESQIETIEEEDQPIDYTKSKTPSIERTTSENIAEYIPVNSQTIIDSNDSNNISINSCSNNVTNNNQSENNNNVNEPAPGTNNVEQKLPKFKITRLNSKRILTKESESSRPLRKRKRIIVEANNNEEEEEVEEENNTA
jgi:hypothetical protein